jgi:hypothetical protein
MEIAFQQAMEKSESEAISNAIQKPRKKKDTDTEQAEILSRTLEKKIGQGS